MAEKTGTRTSTLDESTGNTTPGLRGTLHSNTYYISDTHSSRSSRSSRHGSRERDSRYRDRRERDRRDRDRDRDRHHRYCGSPNDRIILSPQKKQKLCERRHNFLKLSVVFPPSPLQNKNPSWHCSFYFSLENRSDGRRSRSHHRSPRSRHGDEVKDKEKDNSTHHHNDKPKSDTESKTKTDASEVPSQSSVDTDKSTETEAKKTDATSQNNDAAKDGATNEVTSSVNDDVAKTEQETKESGEGKDAEAKEGDKSENSEKKEETNEAEEKKDEKDRRRSNSRRSSHSRDRDKHKVNIAYSPFKHRCQSVVLTSNPAK